MVRFRRGSFLALAGILSCGGSSSSDDESLPLPDRDLDASRDAPAADAPPVVDAGTESGPPVDAGPDGTVYLGCNGAIDCERVVFVTTKEYTGGFGGITEADQRCQGQANGSQNPRVKGHKFVAWLSTTKDAVATRFVHGTKPYVRPDGAVVANDWADLVDGTLDTPIALNEDGAMPGGSTKAWTGTTLTGASAAANCASWTDTTQTGRRGNIGGAGNGWSDSSSDACTSTSHLYCFEY